MGDNLKKLQSETLIHKENRNGLLALNNGLALETQESDIVEVQSTGKPLWCLNLCEVLFAKHRIRPTLIFFIDFVPP